MTGETTSPTPAAAASTGSPIGGSAIGGALIDADRTIDEVFLTPRVLDQGAFQKYATQLEETIRRAGDAGRQLRDAHALTAGTISDTARAGEELKRRLELGAKLLSTIDRRAEEAQQALAKVEAKSAEVDAAETRLDELVAERLSNIEARVGDAVESALGQAHHAADKLHAAERAARSTAANAATMIAQLDDRLRDLSERVESATAHADGAREDLVRRIDDAAGAIDERLARAEALGARILSALGIETDEDADAIERRARESALTVERAERISGVLAGLKDEADDARTRLSGAVQDALTRLREVEGRRIELLEPLTDTYEEIASSVPLLVDSLRAAGEQIAELSETQTALRKGIAESAELAEGARHEVQSRTDQLGAVIRGAELQLEDRVRTSERRLAEMIVRAEQAARRLDSQVKGVSAVEPKPTTPTPPNPAQAGHTHPGHTPQAPTHPARTHPASPRPMETHDFSGADEVARTWRDEDEPDRPSPGANPDPGRDPNAGPRT